MSIANIWSNEFVVPDSSPLKLYHIDIFFRTFNAMQHSGDALNSHTKVNVQYENTVGDVKRLILNQSCAWCHGCFIQQLVNRFALDFSILSCDLNMTHCLLDGWSNANNLFADLFGDIVCVCERDRERIRERD